MNEQMIGHLRRLGYEHIQTDAYELIRRCNDWYRAKITDAHERVRVNGEKYQLERMAFAKRCCADDANLCEVVDINGGGNNQAQQQAVKSLLEQSAFDALYRRQLELCAAEGTAAAYWRVENAAESVQGEELLLRGGRLRLKAVEAGDYVPLALDGEEVTEAAFMGASMEDGKLVYTLVVCTRPDGKAYQYRLIRLDEDDQVLSDEAVVLGEVKPFSVMRTAAVNTIENMQGFGLPKILDAIPVLTGLDQAFTVLLGDIDTADKLVLVNEVLCKFDTDEHGDPKPIPPNEQLKRQFVFFGREKLPDEKSLITEIVPEIRSDSIEKVIELLLSLLSMMFGYGTRKYSFEQGRLETATQYIGERQDQMQELARQQKEAAKYIQELVRAGLWFENTFLGAHWDTEADVLVEFDDSYITDKQAALEDIREDVMAGIGGMQVRKRYLMGRYNLDEETAEQWALDTSGEADPDILS